MTAAKYSGETWGAHQMDQVEVLQQTALDAWQQFVGNGNAERLDSAIAAFRAAAEAAADSSHAEVRAAALSNLSNALLALHQLTGDPVVLSEAVNAGRSAVAIPAGPSILVVGLSNLSERLINGWAGPGGGP
jgi:hypothetical protein